MVVRKRLRSCFFFSEGIDRYLTGEMGNREHTGKAPMTLGCVRTGRKCLVPTHSNGFYPFIQAKEMDVPSRRQRPKAGVRTSDADQTAAALSGLIE